MDDSTDFIFHDPGMHSGMENDTAPHSFGTTEQQSGNLGEQYQGDVQHHLGSGGHDLSDFCLKLLGPGAIHFGEEKGWLDSNADIDLWHLQHHDTCAIVSQQFVLESLTGHSFSENELMKEAQEHGWYYPGGGTPPDHVGDLLKLHGIPIERGCGRSIEYLQSQLDQGYRCGELR